jgi:mono/diheme cytochrome c family protein
MHAWDDKGYPMARPSKAAKAKIDATTLYGRHCATCHQVDGRGMGGHYPALAGNGVVTMADPRALILVMLDGLTPGPTAQDAHPPAMPPFWSTLTDEEAATIATYVRSQWGNHAPAVKPSEVKALRRYP